MHSNTSSKIDYIKLHTTHLFLMQMSLVVAPSQQKETTKIHMHWSNSYQSANKKFMKQTADF